MDDFDALRDQLEGRYRLQRQIGAGGTLPTRLRSGAREWVWSSSQNGMDDSVRRDVVRGILDAKLPRRAAGAHPFIEERYCWITSVRSFSLAA